MQTPTRVILGTMAAVATAATVGAAAADPQVSLPFSDPKWTFQGDAKVEQADGREVLSLRSGLALRRDVRLRDGTIDVDVKLTRHRSFVYVLFRMQSEEEHEEVYLRPHKSSLPDALQYAPVWQGRSAWQLHHGPGGTAAVELPAGEWIHLRLAIADRRAALYVGDMARPAMVMTLARDPAEGFVALRGFLPAGVDAAGPIAQYANLVVQPGQPTVPAAEEVGERPAGIIRAWAVSPALPDTPPPSQPAVARLPGAIGTMRKVEAGPDGLINLHRFVKAPDAGPSKALVRLHLQADRARTIPIDLGFSDVATVFLNGQPLATRDDSYSFDRPRREGLIGFDQLRVYLPLRAGDNELAVLVSDTFGGWGIMGRLPDGSGVGVDAR